MATECRTQQYIPQTLLVTLQNLQKEISVVKYMAKVQFLSGETTLLMFIVPKSYKMNIFFIISPQNRFKGLKTLNPIIFQKFNLLTID